MSAAPEIFKLPIGGSHLIIIHFYNIWLLVVTIIQATHFLAG